MKEISFAWEAEVKVVLESKHVKFCLGLKFPLIAKTSSEHCLSLLQTSLVSTLITVLPAEGRSVKQDSYNS